MNLEHQVHQGDKDHQDPEVNPEKTALMDHRDQKDQQEDQEIQDQWYVHTSSSYANPVEKSLVEMNEPCVRNESNQSE